jgi:hypothetical protein
MRVLTIAASVLAVALVAPDLAAAQGRPGGAGSTAAPVGHRQPTAKDAPSTEPGAPPVQQTKEDRALEKALKGICRGC